MITRKIRMDEVEEKGFKALIHDKDNHVKILVEVSPPMTEVEKAHSEKTLAKL